MTKTLIPRSDSISAKIIEPTDFTKLHSSDLIQNYIISGFTISAGSGLACNVAAGSGRLNGLYISSDATEAKSSLTASQTNSIYIKLDLDSGSEPEGWSLFSNTTGGAVTNAILLGTAVTDGSSVTSVTQSTAKAYNLSTSNTELIPFNLIGDQSIQNIGSGTGGDILYSNGSNWTKLAKGSDGDFLKLASGIPSWVTLPTHYPSTITTQHLDCACITPSSDTSTPGLMKSVGTIANRSGGYFIATFNLFVSGSDSAKVFFKLGGSTVADADWQNHGSSGSYALEKYISRTVTGPTSGQTLEIWGFHNWNDVRTDILDESSLALGTGGGSYCDIIEISPAS